MQGIAKIVRVTALGLAAVTATAVMSVAARPAPAPAFETATLAPLSPAVLGATIEREETPSTSVTTRSSTTRTPAGRPTAAPTSAAPGAPTPASRGPLDRWNAALRSAGSRPADVVLVGDSITEGYWATTDAGRWVSLLRRDLQSRWNPRDVVGGEGFIPARHTLDRSKHPTALPQRWAFNAATAGTDRGFGLGRRAVQLTSAGPSAAITVTGDRLWITYTEGPGAGQLSIDVDGRTATINTQAPVTRSGRRWDSGPLARGAHRVTVTAVGPNPNAVLDGIMVFDGDGGNASNQGRGVRVWESGHAGYQASAFALGDGTWADGLDAIAPDLVLIEFGTNDQVAGVSPAAFESHLRSIVNLVKRKSGAAGAPSIGIVPVWADTTADAGTWAQYRAAMVSVAASEGCAVMDVGASLDKASSSNLVSDLLADTVHLADRGQAWMADTVNQLLSAA